MWNGISGRWVERVVALALAAALSWRMVGLRLQTVIDMAAVIDEWLQTGKVTDSYG